MEYHEISLNEAPLAVNQWIEENKEYENHIVMHTKEKSYIIITMGEKTTGGYDIEVVKVEELEDTIYFIVKYVIPEPDQILIQAVTYPFIIIEMERVAKEIVVIIHK